MGDKRWTVSHREIERLTARPRESKVVKSIVVVVLVFLLFSFILKVVIFFAALSETWRRNGFRDNVQELLLFAK